MTLPQIFLIVVVAISLLLVGLNRLRIDVAALLIAVMLGIAQCLGMGVLGAEGSSSAAIKAISGFSQPLIFTLLSLFVITRSLEKSGLTNWAARYLLKIGGNSEKRLIALFATSSALLSLIMNNLAAGALILPSAMEIARRTGIKPSKLLIPVAYGSLLGGVATYFTTANIIVSNLLVTANPPQQPLHILAFTKIGAPIAIAGISFIALFGLRWLPDRDPMPEQMMARLTCSDLENLYQLAERLWDVEVMPASPLVNKSLVESKIGGRFGLTVIAIKRRQQLIFAPTSGEIIRSGDILLIIGREDRVSELTKVELKISSGNAKGLISKSGVTFVEIMPSPHSQALGRTLRELEFRTKYHLTAIALFRGGRSYRTDVGNFPLMLGDTLLTIGSRSRLQRLRNNPDFILLEPNLSDQPVKSDKAVLTLGVLVMAIVASSLGAPVFLSLLAGALFLILTKMIDMEEAYRSIDWQSIISIGGMYAMSLAMVNTGLAQKIGDFFLSLVLPFGSLGLAAGAYLMAAFLTQVMGGQVTALVAGPITISAAIKLHGDPQIVAIATAIGCSASFLTPMAHPVNILMIAPANYCFRDFLRLGWRLTMVCVVTLIFVLVLFGRL